MNFIKCYCLELGLEIKIEFNLLINQDFKLKPDSINHVNSEINNHYVVRKLANNMLFK
jgi:hypothetical protein